LIRAIWRAARWLGQPANHSIAADLLAAPGRLSVGSEVIERVLTGRLLMAPHGAEQVVPRFIEFHAGAANFPWRSQAAWIGARLAKRHGLNLMPAIEAARSVFRSDLYRQHLRGTGAELPGASDKVEGSLAVPTAASSFEGRLILMPDQFFDARIFDPMDPER
jgi:NitT/TauT family transport system ATP-binding protein